MAYSQAEEGEFFYKLAYVTFFLSQSKKGKRVGGTEVGTLHLDLSQLDLTHWGTSQKGSRWACNAENPQALPQDEPSHILASAPPRV
jgi:hypothetical protein